MVRGDADAAFLTLERDEKYQPGERAAQGAGDVGVNLADGVLQRDDVQAPDGRAVRAGRLKRASTPGRDGRLDESAVAVMSAPGASARTLMFAGKAPASVIFVSRVARRVAER